MKKYLNAFRSYKYMLLMLFVISLGFGVPAVQGKTLSRGTRLKLQEASKLTEAGKAHEAIERLQLLEGALQAKAFELAMVRQCLVYAHMAAEEPAVACDIAVKVLKGGQLPAEAAHALIWLTAQMAYQLEDYGTCAHYAQQWIAAESRPPAKAHFLAGFSHYQLKQLRAAEKHLEQAIALAKKIPDDWRKVLLAVYLDGRQYPKAETVLHSLIESEPDNRSWWNHLAVAYLEQNKEDKALAALVLAHHRSRLDTDDLMRIVQLYSSNGIPEKAARLLRNWLKSGRLAANRKTYKLQFELWHLACESGPALQALEKAASLADNGQDYYLLGCLHFERNQWQQARDALQRALQRGVKEKARAQYLLGVAAFNCGDPHTAQQAFEKASMNPELGKIVAYWSDRLQDRSTQRRQ
ncbi:MAG: tetratricopeptide repeat protein [Desulfobacteraceae bacterium]|jgi:tetratricopeptide (TPR) repeat protein